jgi:urease accessory protein
VSEEISLPVERRTLARRIWRGQASDGAEFGFELSAPLREGDCIWRADTKRYVVRQRPEPVLEVSLPAVPDRAAVVGWIIGNMHCPIERRDGALAVADEGLMRQVLERAGIAFTPATACFRPGGFAGGMAATGHSHVPGVAQAGPQETGAGGVRAAGNGAGTLDTRGPVAAGKATDARA